MHAVVSTVRIEDVDVARGALPEQRLKLVPRAPGFVSAYWLEPVDGIGMSVIMFKTREHAEAAVAYPAPPLPGVTLLPVETRELSASACAGVMPRPSTGAPRLVMLRLSVGPIQPRYTL